MLSVKSSKHTPLLEDFTRELQREGIPWQLTQHEDLRSNEIIVYANSHECISSVMINSLSNWIETETDKGKNPWRKLNCPLVVVTPD